MVWKKGIKSGSPPGKVLASPELSRMLSGEVEVARNHMASSRDCEGGGGRVYGPIQVVSGIARYHFNIPEGSQEYS